MERNAKARCHSARRSFHLQTSLTTDFVGGSSLRPLIFISASATVPHWVHFADFFTASCHRVLSSPGCPSSTNPIHQLRKHFEDYPE
jgi:hypothetical protein